MAAQEGDASGPVQLREMVSVGAETVSRFQKVRNVILYKYIVSVSRRFIEVLNEGTNRMIVQTRN